MAGSRRIAVYGSSTVSEDEPGYALARALGRELGRLGAVVVTGGYGGIMEAASRGAVEARGRAIGITVDLYAARGEGNRWLSERWNTPDLFERLRRLTTECDGFVAVTGSLGTLAEVYLTWTLIGAGARSEAPLVLLGAGWRECLEAQRRAGFVAAGLLRHARLTSDASEAARWATGAAPGEPAASPRPPGDDLAPGPAGEIASAP